MNQQEKKKFIRNLCNSVRDELIGKVGRMPKEWDGIELREIVIVKFANESFLQRKEHRDNRRLAMFQNYYYSSNL